LSRIHYLLEAEEEILQAVNWYYDQEQTLATDFYREFQIAEADIKAFPEFWTPLAGGYRRKMLNRYPYSLIYRIEDDLLLVTALAHTSRKPDYWRKRL
jgi:hypothetical protein